MAKQIRPLLMFDGKAEEAMDFYVSLFPNSEVLTRHHYSHGANEGKLQQGSFRLNGIELICIDTSIKHAFTFTPATSIFVDCEDEEELERLFGMLSESGDVLMPIDNYGFSQKYGWVSDRYGVSWQLTLN